MSTVKFLLWFTVWITLLFGNISKNVIDVVTFFVALALLSAIYLSERCIETKEESE